MSDMKQKTYYEIVESNLTSKREIILGKAIELTTGDREDHHGKVYENMESLSKIWSLRLGVDIKPHQAALMLADLKLMRVWNGKSDFVDHFVDGAGYMAIAGEVAMFEKELSDGQSEDND